MRSGPSLRQVDLFADVRPKGWLAERLRNVANPRRWRWNVYLRACRAIPASSPVAGSTSWKKINARRLWLIERGKREGDPEFQALQRVAGTMGAGWMTVDCFLMSRKARRIRVRK